MPRDQNGTVEQPLVLNMRTLRQGLEQVLGAAEVRFGSEVELGADYYWQLPLERLYDLDTPSEGELHLGQLSDDLESLDDLLDRDPDDGVVVWHDLGHVIGLLQRLAALDLPAVVGS